MTHKINNQDELVEDVKARQENTVWPDTLKNSSSVDAFLWKGSPDAPLVQRMGAWILGLFFFGWGLVFSFISYKEHSWAVVIYAVVGILLGAKIFWNGCKRNSRHRQSHKE